LFLQYVAMVPVELHFIIPLKYFSTFETQNSIQVTTDIFKDIREKFKGDIYTDEAMRVLYATDASAYREMPLAVCRPACEADIVLLINLAREKGLSLIPRAAGTSLAGQVVGNGIVVDISRYFTKIVEINPGERYARVQPGVILDELNMAVRPYGLFFGPETSTSSRCMMGGMAGNNSCGAHSLIYGSTRDHLLSVKALLSDGSAVEFGELTAEEFHAKTQLPGLEGDIYRNIYQHLSGEDNRERIISEFPDPRLRRRNTGYAVDELLKAEVFGGNQKFNFCKLIAGSEGTLAFITELKLNLVDLPPAHKALVCVHLEDVPRALEANIIALRHSPSSVELMDKPIMDLTKENRIQQQNRFFVKGDPGAILIVEFAESSIDEIHRKAAAMEEDMRREGYGFHFPLVTGDDIKKVWALRKAGLGILSNMPGDAKPVPVIEDTAVHPEVLPAYIAEFDKVLAENNLSCVYYAHIATGELHLRPVLNLKDKEGVRLFRLIATESARLVKKYRGSLSGEHGDGRLRGEFIPFLIGEENYKIIKDIKRCWDPHGIFNPGKITDTPPMDKFLRYTPGKPVREIETVFDFSRDGGYLRAVEKCNGSGDCRKTVKSGGVMCPSYMATLDEQNATRARANTLREYITNAPGDANPFDSIEIYNSLDLCLSCKGCKTECPSNVDMTKFKAEFMQHYYDAHHIPLRTRFIAYIHIFNSLGAVVPAFYNFFLKNRFVSAIIKKSIGFAPARSIPLLYKFTLRSWIKRNPVMPVNKKGKVWLFADEFTNYNDVETGIKAVRLLTGLGYEVVVPSHKVSGRTFLSKGLLRKAKKIAEANVNLLKDKVSEETPLVGIEPSAILGFRDEYPELVDKGMVDDARRLAANALMFDEFFIREVEKGNISKESFTSAARHIKLHGHCHQKAVASTAPTLKMLSFPRNYTAEEIPSGCCGMAGSFGFEKEHYDLSMKVGELVLFPAVRAMAAQEIIAAPGTSCRHQIADGTDRKALHPIEIMYDALAKN
jgi:FAD/FMN-containing dehydrogenase/Fe-S oxidoreductase